MQTNSKNGFTLIEMAFVMLIVGLLVTLGIETLPLMIKQNKLSENKAIVKDAKTAIIGYVKANGRLPFAAATANGNPTNATYRGYLPYATLGMSRNDSAGRVLRYAVDGELTQTTSANIVSRLSTLISNPASRAANRPAQNCRSYPTGGPNTPVAFVVFSEGENGAINAPNAVAGNNAFEAPEAPLIDPYDDILAAPTLVYLLGVLSVTP